MEVSLAVGSLVRAGVPEEDKVALSESAVADALVSDAKGDCCAVEGAVKTAFTVISSENVVSPIVSIVVFDYSLGGQCFAGKVAFEVEGLFDDGESVLTMSSRAGDYGCLGESDGAASIGGVLVVFTVVVS